MTVCPALLTVVSLVSPGVVTIVVAPLYVVETVPCGVITETGRLKLSYVYVLAQVTAFPAKNGSDSRNTVPSVLYSVITEILFPLSP